MECVSIGKDNLQFQELIIYMSFRKTSITEYWHDHHGIKTLDYNQIDWEPSQVAVKGLPVTNKQHFVPQFAAG